MLGWLGFTFAAVIGDALLYILAAGLLALGVYCLIAFWSNRLIRIGAALLIAAGVFVGAFTFGKSTTLAGCISQARLAAVQAELAAANKSLEQWKATADLRSEQLREMAKRRSERDANLAQSQARVEKLPDAVRRGRAATRDDDRELCRIAGGKAPGC